jgi:hypothetical protein
LLVAILRRGHERSECRQLLQRTGCCAFIGVQVYELARVRQLEDRVAKSRRSGLREFRKDPAIFALVHRDRSGSRNSSTASETLARAGIEKRASRAATRVDRHERHRAPAGNLIRINEMR